MYIEIVLIDCVCQWEWYYCLASQIRYTKQPDRQLISNVGCPAYYSGSLWAQGKGFVKDSDPWAREMGIMLFVLPEHMSHILQPLDVAMFGPFKNYYHSACSTFMAENIGQIITRYDICQIACKAYTRAMSHANIQSSFRKTGIFPHSHFYVSFLSSNWFRVKAFV